MGVSTGELVRRLRETLPPYQQKRLTHLAMPGPGRKAHQLNWALRPEALREILGEDLDPAGVFVGVSDADSIPDPDTYRDRPGVAGPGALATRASRSPSLTSRRHRGKICAIQQSRYFIRCDSQLISEVKRGASSRALSPGHAHGRSVRPVFELMCRAANLLGPTSCAPRNARFGGGFPLRRHRDSTLDISWDGHHDRASPWSSCGPAGKSEKVIRQNARWYLAAPTLVLGRTWRAEPTAFNWPPCATPAKRWSSGPSRPVYPLWVLGGYIEYTYSWEYKNCFYVAIAAPTRLLPPRVGGSDPFGGRGLPPIPAGKRHRRKSFKENSSASSGSEYGSSRRGAPGAALELGRTGRYEEGRRIACVEAPARPGARRSPEG